VPRETDAVAVFEQARRQLRRARRAYTLAGVALFTLALTWSCVVGEVSVAQFVQGLPGLFHYFWNIAPEIQRHSVLRDIASWYWGIGRWLRLLGDTIVMAFLGTLFGACGAFLLCFAASRNLMPSTTVYFCTRRVMDIARAVPELVYAMLFVFSFGLGPLPGVLAIALHSMGALGKLFSEVNENVDGRPIEGALAAGVNWCQMIRFAVVPQVFPGFLSYTLLRFEINVRAAAVIGFVGAGGIGQELLFVIHQFVYSDISAIVLLIMLTVSVIDMACEQLRHRVIGLEA
jgi:phosphonate transport system permease protein